VHNTLITKGVPKKNVFRFLDLDRMNKGSISYPDSAHEPHQPVRG
jgi:hypothetical protein